MSSDLYDELYKYIESFCDGCGPYGISRRHFIGRIHILTEQEGRLIFSMERHKPLGIGYMSGYPMDNMITILEKYAYFKDDNNEPTIELLEAKIVDYIIDIYSQVKKVLKSILYL